MLAALDSLKEGSTVNAMVLSGQMKNESSPRPFLKREQKSELLGIKARGIVVHLISRLFRSQRDQY